MHAVVLDACVLVPHPLFDTLLRLADAGLYRPLWSDQILTEVERTLTHKLGVAAEKANRRIEQMRSAFPDAAVEGYEGLIEVMTNDPKDRHVLAAAVHGRAAMLVTANLTDFPALSTRHTGVEVVHPDTFLTELLSRAPGVVASVLREQRAAYANPRLTQEQFYGAFSPTVPTFAALALSGERGPDSKHPPSDVV